MVTADHMMVEWRAIGICSLRQLGFQGYGCSGYGAPGYGYGAASNGVGYGVRVYGGAGGGYNGPSGAYGNPSAGNACFACCPAVSHGVGSATGSCGVPSTPTGQSPSGATGYENQGYGYGSYGGNDGSYANPSGYGAVGGRGGSPNSNTAGVAGGEQWAGSGYMGSAIMMLALVTRLQDGGCPIHPKVVVIGVAKQM
ncbi:hypothetical protein FRX31_004682 [Thalictrum thalictroides]|uniref:Uncharacterized protein n=1 Tax=Thalictrum thalictroides TaxID=46969 RepID=A0A7J6X9X8_THATH|nr:hypothetical protein FRX31_004682 [Thalictrum thalictroides]